MDQLDLSYKLLQQYTSMCKELTQKYQITQTELDIIMFLANHPHYHSAKDIVKVRGIKANLVSMSVEKLVKKNMLLRKEVEGDRRATQLILTKETTKLVVEGKKIQQEFFGLLFKGISENEKAEFLRIISMIHSNIESMRNE